MRKFVLLASTVAAVLTATATVVAPPASAATTATFTLTAGTLSISAPTAPMTLGSQVASTVSSTMSGSLGVVTVSDQQRRHNHLDGIGDRHRLYTHCGPGRPGQQCQLCGRHDHGISGGGGDGGQCIGPNRCIDGRDWC